MQPASILPWQLPSHFSGPFPNRSVNHYPGVGLVGPELLTSAPGQEYKEKETGLTQSLPLASSMHVAFGAPCKVGFRTAKLTISGIETMPILESLLAALNLFAQLCS